MDKERERERERERDDLVRSLVAAAGCGQASSVFGGKTVWRPFGSRTSDKTSVFVVVCREVEVQVCSKVLGCMSSTPTKGIHGACRTACRANSVEAQRGRDES